MALATKVFVITGTASGIGEASVRYLAELGATIVCADNRQKLGEEVVQDLKDHGYPNIVFFKCDVHKEKCMKKLADFAVAKYGKIDVWWNNAGIEGTINKDVTEMLESDFNHVFDVNVKGPMFGLKYAALQMTKQMHGIIINTSSVSSVKNFPGLTAYCMSKAALDRLARAAAEDLDCKDIQVYNINPCVFASEMTKRSAKTWETSLEKMALYSNPSKIVGAPRDVGKIVSMLALKELPQYKTGSCIVIDAGPIHFLLDEYLDRMIPKVEEATSTMPLVPTPAPTPAPAPVTGLDLLKQEHEATQGVEKLAVPVTMGASRD